MNAHPHTAKASGAAIRRMQHRALGEEIRLRVIVLRAWLGLTPQEMAARLGMQPGTWREWERPGRRQWAGRLNVTPMRAVARETGASLYWLLMGGHPGQSPSAVPLLPDGNPMPLLGVYPVVRQHPHCHRKNGRTPPKRHGRPRE